MADREPKENESDWSWSGGRMHSWMPGIVLILIGAVFLLRNFYHIELRNWWALFILFPALSNFAGAYEQYRQTHELSRRVRGRLFAGLVFTLLSGSFLLSLDFGLLWPAFLILAGLGILLGVLVSSRQQKEGDASRPLFISCVLLTESALRRVR